MLCLLFEFPAGRYHATPWGHHVNEGLVEWPPSPWRILRALLATGFTKMGWDRVPSEMRALVETLAANLPAYRVPRATVGHTRHYLPVTGLDKKRGVQNTSLVIDAFVRPHGGLGVRWPAEVDAQQQKLLSDVLDRLGYLGRAESRVRARLVSRDDLPDGWDVSTERRDANDDPVRLLAPLPSIEYENWRQNLSGVPKDLLEALQVETNALQEADWNAPPGSREVVYWRPLDVLSPRFAARVARSVGIAPADTALFALSTDRKRDVLPLMERALPTMALFRRALLSKLGDEASVRSCPELTGKDETGRALEEGHRHAHFIPLSLDPRNGGRIDHVLVHAPMGFGHAAQRALRRLKKTWAKGMDDIAVTLVGIGSLSSFRTAAGVPLVELGEGTTWESRTPFIPPRFLKPRGKDSIEGQIRAEVRARGLPDIVTPPRIAVPTADDEVGMRARWFRHFVRTRQNGPAATPPPGVFHVTLTFERPVTGPLSLGWGCHFGLGLFAPAKVSKDTANP